jgi:hypothetical protein
MPNIAPIPTRRTPQWAVTVFVMYWLTTWGVTVAPGGDRRLAVLLHLLLPFAAGAMAGWWQWWQHVPTAKRLSGSAGTALLVIQVDLAIAVVAEAIAVLAGAALSSWGPASSFAGLAGQDGWIWLTRLVLTWAQFALYLGMIGVFAGAVGGTLGGAIAAGVRYLTAGAKREPATGVLRPAPSA